MHRFTLGCGRVDQADRLIDFVVALEALLLPYDKEARNSNLSYRFSLHGAFFLAEAPLERRTVFEGLKKLYDTRSRLVHGGGYPDPAETMADACDELPPPPWRALPLDHLTRLPGRNLHRT